MLDPQGDPQLIFDHVTGRHQHLTALHLPASVDEAPGQRAGTARSTSRTAPTTRLTWCQGSSPSGPCTRRLRPAARTARRLPALPPASPLTTWPPPPGSPPGARGGAGGFRRAV